jgi:tetratricopeptide (TPR) repeat protein
MVEYYYQYINKQVKTIMTLCLWKFITVVMLAVVVTTIAASKVQAKQPQLSDHQQYEMLRQKAEPHHQQGLVLAEKGQYQQSLPYFRLAARLCPTHFTTSSNKRASSLCAQYWSDLGVTEMRMGQYPRALTRFLRAQAMDSAFIFSVQNIDAVKQYMSPEEFERVVEQTQRDLTLEEQMPDADSMSITVGVAKQSHTLLPFPELRAKDLIVHTNRGDTSTIKQLVGDFRKYLSAPFVIRNALSYWANTSTNLPPFSHPKNYLDYLTKRFGTQRVDFYPHNMKLEDVHPVFTTLSEALAGLLDETQLNVYDGVDVSEKGTYIQVGSQGQQLIISLFAWIQGICIRMFCSGICRQTSLLTF